MTIAVWQTLLDEASGFADEVRARRIRCVIEAGREAGQDSSRIRAAAALDHASAAFESAYLGGVPMTNLQRSRIIGDHIGVEFATDQARELGDRLSATHRAEGLRARPGAADMLAELSRHTRIVALSDTWMSPGSTLRDALTRQGLAPYLETMRFSDETGTHKVTGEAWEEVARALSISVDSIVHIGDLPPVDGTAAVEAGCSGAILIACPEHPVPTEAIATHPRIRMIAHLSDVVLALQEARRAPNYAF